VDNSNKNNYCANVLVQDLSNHATVASCFISAPGNFLFEHVPEGYYLVRITTTSRHYSVSPADNASCEMLVTISNQSVVDLGTVMIAGEGHGIGCIKEVTTECAEALKTIQASNVSGPVAVKPSLPK